MSAVLNPCMCVSFPGEAWRAAGCTSMKRLAQNQRRTEVEIRARVSNQSRRSAYRALLQKGRITEVFKSELGARRERIDVDPVWPRSEERRVGKECRSRWSPD